MKIQFHGVDDSNGPVGVYLISENDEDVQLLAALLLAVGNNKGDGGIFACPSDKVWGTDNTQRVINGVLDIFPGGQ